MEKFVKGELFPDAFSSFAFFVVVAFGVSAVISGGAAPGVFVFALVVFILVGLGAGFRVADVGATFIAETFRVVFAFSVASGHLARGRATLCIKTHWMTEKNEERRKILRKLRIFLYDIFLKIFFKTYGIQPQCKRRRKQVQGQTKRLVYLENALLACDTIWLMILNGLTHFLGVVL